MGALQSPRARVFNKRKSIKKTNAVPNIFVAPSTPPSPLFNLENLKTIFKKFERNFQLNTITYLFLYT